MGITGMAMAAVILAGACQLLYISLWKNKGNCCGFGCSGGSCHKK